MFSPQRGFPGGHFNTGKNKSKAAWSCFCSWAFCLCSATVLSRAEQRPKWFKGQTAGLSTPFAVPRESRAPDWAAPGEMLSSIRPPQLTNKEKRICRLWAHTEWGGCASEMHLNSILSSAGTSFWDTYSIPALWKHPLPTNWQETKRQRFKKHICKDNKKVKCFLHSFP